MQNSNTDNQGNPAPNVRILVNLAFAFAICFLIASMLPKPVIAPALEMLLFWCSVGSGIAAWWTGDRMLSPHLTRWDEMVALLALSFVAGFFTDPEAARQFVEAHRSAGSGGVAYRADGTTV